MKLVDSLSSDQHPEVPSEGHASTKVEAGEVAFENMTTYRLVSELEELGIPWEARLCATRSKDVTVDDVLDQLTHLDEHRRAWIADVVAFCEGTTSEMPEHFPIEEGEANEVRRNRGVATK